MVKQPFHVQMTRGSSKAALTFFFLVFSFFFFFEAARSQILSPSSPQQAEKATKDSIIVVQGLRLFRALYADSASVPPPYDSEMTNSSCGPSDEA